jgi:DNA polymerase-3 subunit alpha
MASRSSSEAAAGQNDLFASGGGNAEELVLPRRDSWLPMERLAQEFEAIGFYLSGHPLDDYTKALARLNVDSWAVFREKVLQKGASAGKIAGTVTFKQERRSRQGNKFAFVGFSDPTGQFESVCFSDTLNAAREMLEPGKALILRVEADVEGDDVKLRLQSVEPVEKATAGIVQGIQIFVRDSKCIDSIAMRLQQGGRAPVKITCIQDRAREIDISLGNRFAVTPQVKGAIKAINGVVDVLDL